MRLVRRNVAKISICLVSIVAICCMAGCGGGTDPQKSTKEYDADYEQANRLIEQGDTALAREVLLELGGYKDSDKLLEAIECKSYAEDLAVQLTVSSIQLSLIGIEVHYEFDPLQYTFTKVIELPKSGLLGGLSSLGGNVDGEDIEQDEEAYRETAEDLFFDNFYLNGYRNIICKVESRNLGNGSHGEGVFDPSKDVPDGYTMDEYAAIRDFIIVDGALVEYTGISKHITIPEGVTKVCADAFPNYTEILSLVCPSTLKEIEEKAFAGWIALENIELPSGLCSIGANAFYATDSLGELVIPDSVEKLPAEGLCGTGAVKIVLPHKITVLEENVLRDADRLESLVVPDGVTSIGEYAFSGDMGLKEITIPNTVEHIATTAFSYCHELADIFYSGTKDDWNQVYTHDEEKGIMVIVHCKDGDIALDPYGLMTIAEDDPAYELWAGTYFGKGLVHDNFEMRLEKSKEAGYVTCHISREGSYHSEQFELRIDPIIPSIAYSIIDEMFTFERSDGYIEISSDSETEFDFEGKYYTSKEEAENKSVAPIEMEKLLGTWRFYNQRGIIHIYCENEKYYLNYVVRSDKYSQYYYLLSSAEIIQDGNAVVVNYQEDSAGNSGTIQISLDINGCYYMTASVDRLNIPRDELERDNLPALISFSEELFYEKEAEDTPLFKEYILPNLCAERASNDPDDIEYYRVDANRYQWIEETTYRKAAEYSVCLTLAAQEDGTVYFKIFDENEGVKYEGTADLYDYSGMLSFWGYDINDPEMWVYGYYSEGEKWFYIETEDGVYYETIFR